MKSTAAVAAEGERCKRSGSKWRCPKRVMPGKVYCEKHQLYISSRRKNTRVTFSDGGVSSAKCDSTSAAVVEPYRPVIDFSAAEVDGGGGGGNGGSFVEEGELMGWLLGNDRFALPEQGFGGEGFGSFGDIRGNDGFALGESGNGRENESNDGFALGELGNGFGNMSNDGFAPGELGNGCRNGFALGESGNWCGNESNDSFAHGESGNECRNESNDGFALGESGSGSGNESNDGFACGEMAKGQNGKVSCDENVIVVGIEAKSGVVGGYEMVGKGQKRKRGQPKKLI
ncbi:hypothetical protein RND81_05G100800 [Saponaria officinalis]|uniref:WRC domain-containing protein n=1 Tax=Saponaria officinalis TaxID=3572 RepID=A0AAW1KU85_SAPOF